MPDRRGITVDVDLVATDHPIMTLRVSTPQGVVTVMAEVAVSGRIMELSGVHMHSDSGPNTFGGARLRSLANALMEILDVDVIVVEGARRTTGASPGHRTGPLRFTRKAAAQGRGQP